MIEPGYHAEEAENFARGGIYTEKNVGGIDKILRFIVAVAAVFVGVSAPIAGGFRIVAFVAAAIALFTGIYGF